MFFAYNMDMFCKYMSSIKTYKKKLPGKLTWKKYTVTLLKVQNYLASYFCFCHSPHFKVSRVSVAAD